MTGGERMDGAAFRRVRDDRGALSRTPVDTHAVYGSVVLADRDPPGDAPHRDGFENLVTAIRTARPGDRVRVNDGSWMEVVETEAEGFIAVYDSGSVRYSVLPSNPMDRPSGTFHSPWMRREDDWSSEGEVHSLEVGWSGEADRRP